MSDWLGAYLRDEGSALRLGSGPIDQQCREQIAVAAQLLCSIRPNHGDVEILLHEIARARARRRHGIRRQRLAGRVGGPAGRLRERAGVNTGMAPPV
jgi:hypothetical protein